MPSEARPAHMYKCSGTVLGRSPGWLISNYPHMRYTECHPHGWRCDTECLEHLNSRGKAGEEGGQCTNCSELQDWKPLSGMLEVAVSPKPHTPMQYCGRQAICNTLDTVNHGEGSSSRFATANGTSPGTCFLVRAFRCWFCLPGCATHCYHYPHSAPSWFRAQAHGGTP